ncbi:MAG: hypothetical protein FWC85_02740 [Elusimicrobia bacterium]|nr:hypothetical protein [Elusimicrobiota bacterium]
MKKFLTLIGIMFLFYGALYAIVDTAVITLNDGTVIEGNIANQTPSTIFVVTREDWVELNRNEVASVVVIPQRRPGDVVSLFYDFHGTVADNIKMRELIFKIGGDFNSRFTSGGSTQRLSDGAFSAAVEYFQYVSDFVALGAGVSAQFPRSLDGVPGRFGFAPVYAALKLRSLPQKPNMYGYAVGHIGYNIFYSTGNFPGDLSGGFYWAAGFGIVLQRLVFEFLYSMNTGAIRNRDMPGQRITVENPKFTFSVGVVF